ncbi:hypothetical protein QTH89_24725 [Variovorax sp. J22G21]|nr:hypothetical protein [Variovorax sp. J22R193]MDM0039669.1 hypothetical protein [Variovorax sp. J22R193]MDM0064444.1 hypothetical protein [Variovorax sp. J22G21]
MPEMFEGAKGEWQLTVNRAWHEATMANYPEFLAAEKLRLVKVLERGRIKTEAEFYRVRHEVDLLEGRPELHEELHKLYNLIDAYEAR